MNLFEQVGRMFECPFDIISCSWPHPVNDSENHQWEPVPMFSLPQPRWEMFQDKLYWALNWSDFFQCELKPHDPVTGGEMRGFEIVFRLSMKMDGELMFLYDTGCIISRDKVIIYSSNSNTSSAPNVIKVSKGDYLDIIQWHFKGEWVWAADISREGQILSTTPTNLLLPYLNLVRQRLLLPDGPALKMFTHGHFPMRTIVSIYSLILNGYAPSGIYLFNEESWSTRTRALFQAMLPFVHVVSSQEVTAQLHSSGGERLVDIAEQYWFVKKTCVSLFCEPKEYCFMDDDVFILEALNDALEAFKDHNLVYSPDQDLGEKYALTWGLRHTPSQPLRTAKFLAALCWIRNTTPPNELASLALQVEPDPKNPPLWEQGFIATVYANDRVVDLPSQRYLLPVLDGLPGGTFGYDYLNNPCGFTSIHFGGFVKKPSEGAVLYLMPKILDRHLL